jgi:NADPH-dependent 2,4-dienoyl-CoA reductase/sulfur reductase-like enzyme
VDIADGIACDANLNAGIPGVYAAGDVARWHCQLFDRPLRVEHWTNAAEQGAHAARNALDPANAEPFDGVPYFWSDCYDSKIQFVGTVDADETHLAAGDLDSRRFTVLYRRGDRVVGGLTMNNPGHSARCQALIGSGASWRDAVDALGRSVGERITRVGRN